MWILEDMINDRPGSSNFRNGGNEWVEAADLLDLWGVLGPKKSFFFWGGEYQQLSYFNETLTIRKEIGKDMHDEPEWFEELVFSICIWNVRISPKKLQ